MSLTDRGKARCSESCTAGLERGVEKRAVLCEKQSHQSDATRSAPTLLKGTSPVRRREWGDVPQGNAPCSYPTRS
jgi:hypothetical protein